MLSKQTQLPVSRVKFLDSNCHVSGKFGDWLPSEAGNRRGKHARLFGTIIATMF
jgi:hypothetical protein